MHTNRASESLSGPAMESDLAAKNINSARAPFDSTPALALFSLNVAKNILGSFILFIPWAFELSGLLLGLFMLALAATMSVYTFALIAFLARATPTSPASFSAMFLPMGRATVVCVDLSIIALSISVNAGYIIFTSSLQLKMPKHQTLIKTITEQQ